MRGSGRVITSRPSSEMVVSSVLITGAQLRLDNSRTKWTLAVSVRNGRRIRNVESSNVAVGGLCLFRVLSRSRSTENSVELEPFTSCFYVVKLISIHDSGRAIVRAKGSKSLKRVTVYLLFLPLNMKSPHFCDSMHLVAALPFETLELFG